MQRQVNGPNMHWHHQEKGFALLTVLVTAVVMGLLATVISITSRESLLSSRHLLEMQRAQNSTEAALTAEMNLGMPCMKSGGSWSYSAIPLTTLGTDYEYDIEIQRVDQPFTWMPPGQANGRNCILPPEVPGGTLRPDRLYLLQIRGRWRTASANVEVVVQADSSHNNFTVVSRREVGGIR